VTEGKRGQSQWVSLPVQHNIPHFGQNANSIKEARVMVESGKIFFYGNRLRSFFKTAVQGPIWSVTF